MSIHSEGDDWIWSQRKTYNKKYTDDQLFEFTSSGSDCDFTAKSRSQAMSYLDNDVNFCNMWNIVSRIDGFGDMSVSHCSQHDHGPSDPKTTCARY